jgi:hypothetical protein
VYVYCTTATTSSVFENHSPAGKVINSVFIHLFSEP